MLTEFKEKDRVYVNGSVCLGKDDYSYDVLVDTFGIIEVIDKNSFAFMVTLDEIDGEINVCAYVDRDIVYPIK